jgi:hypothetical protein
MKRRNVEDGDARKSRSLMFRDPGSGNVGSGERKERETWLTLGRLRIPRLPVLWRFDFLRGSRYFSPTHFLPSSVGEHSIVSGAFAKVPKIESDNF